MDQVFEQGLQEDPKKFLYGPIKMFPTFLGVV